MRTVVVAAVAIVLVAAPVARAADPKPPPPAPVKADPKPPPPPAAVAPPKQAALAELGGWATPPPADMAVLERLEGANLAEARKQGALKIVGTKKDLDGDGIPELFFYVKNPMFCYPDGCVLLVVHRPSLTDPWSEIGALVVGSTSVAIEPATDKRFPTLRPAASNPYVWDGQVYKEERGHVEVLPATEGTE